MACFICPIKSKGLAVFRKSSIVSSSGTALNTYLTVPENLEHSPYNDNNNNNGIEYMYTISL